MTDLPAAEKFLTAHIQMPGGELLCAVSGGLDSMCLLDFVVRWAKKRGMTAAAAHFNHGLRGENADRDEAFVRDYCAENAIPFLAGRGDTRDFSAREGLSVEEAARRLRYGFLETLQAQRHSAGILTAHHADDNAETMLLNLCRGTGSAGLGIPPVRGHVYRPFLEISKAELASYASAHGLPHVEDETNAEDCAARNLLRHKVFPVLREINPRAVENMARAAELLAAEDAALERLAESVLAQARVEERRASLDWAHLQAAPETVRGRAALGLMERVCGRRKDLSSAHAGAVLALEKGRECSLPYGLLARNSGTALEIFAAPPPPEAVDIAPGKTVVFGTWYVTLAGGTENSPPLTVTRWRTGDRMSAPGGRGSRTLKRLWADAGVAPSQRETLPVLRQGERLIAAPYIGMDADFAAGWTGGQVKFEIEGESK